MDFHGRDEGYYFLVAVPRNFSIHNMAEARKVINEALDAGHKNFVFNLSVCNFVDSSSIGLLANFGKKCKSMGGRLVLLKPAKTVQELLSMTGMTEIILIYQSNAELEKTFEEDKRVWAINRATRELAKKRQGPGDHLPKG